MLRLSSSSQWTSVWITSNDKTIMVREMLGEKKLLQFMIACLDFEESWFRIAGENVIVGGGVNWLRFLWGKF